jgi:serine/threonine-protein kinase HipA
MHLKNWSLLYPDGRTPTLSPAYDLVSTVPYLPGDRLALNLAGTKEFAEVTLARFGRLAERAHLRARDA